MAVISIITSFDIDSAFECECLVCSDLDIPTSSNRVDIGVRVELPAEVFSMLTDELYESKIVYRTEKYEDKDLSVESNPYFKYPNTNRGDSRLKSYSNLIKRSEQISCPFTGDLKGTIFFFEPFYQLMRHTLWAEQMIAHKDSEVLKADDFIHLHIIPSANRDLLNKIYPVSQQTMEETWRSVLSDQSKYRIITPKALFSPIHKKDKNLTNYLEHRYWLGDRQI